MGISIQLRRGTAAEWIAADPVLLAGEVGYETDTNKFKFGDGTSLWSELDYAKADPVDGMLKATYDTDDDGIVDKAAAIDDGDHSATAEDIESAVGATHNQNTDTVLTSNGTTPVIDAGVLKATLTLAENIGLKLDDALSDDNKYCGIAIEAGTLGETVAFGEVIYFKAADSQWYLAKADAAATASGKIGMCLTGGNDNDPTVILLIGKIRADAKFPTLTIGAPVFLSAATAGAVVASAPAKSTGHIVRVLGRANTADEMWFNPSQDWIEYA